MQTHFSPTQLADPDTASSNKQLRACVHCGFCTATCPTYLLLGDELDSPRGRIYLIKDMLEKGEPPTPTTVLHLDRCLTCLSCMTTCPSGVNYMHLVDHARAYIEDHKVRPLHERMLRAALVTVLSNRLLFRLALLAAAIVRPFAGLLPKKFRAMALDAPSPHGPSAASLPGSFAARGPKRARMALLSGCVQPVVDPAIDEAAIRLLNRHGVEMVVAKNQSCCGALAHHMGDHDTARRKAKDNIEAWEAEIAGEGLDAIVITASGCGTVLKDYGFIFRDDPAWAARAAKISSLCKDVTEVLAGLDLKASVIPAGQPIAYHSACSMQHGQKISLQPRELLAKAGFAVAEIAEGHICCGSAGTYSMLQPELSGQLRARKLANIHATGAPIVASGNIGCLTHLSKKPGQDGARMIHTVQLLDWATGGPRPDGI